MDQDEVWSIIHSFIDTFQILVLDEETLGQFALEFPSNRKTWNISGKQMGTNRHLNRDVSAGEISSPNLTSLHAN